VTDIDPDDIDTELEPPVVQELDYRCPECNTKLLIPFALWDAINAGNVDGRCAACQANEHLRELYHGCLRRALRVGDSGRGDGG
jgi:hypothetical protein